MFTTFGFAACCTYKDTRRDGVHTAARDSFSHKWFPQVALQESMDERKSTKDWFFWAVHTLQHFRVVISCNDLRRQASSALGRGVPFSGCECLPVGTPSHRNACSRALCRYSNPKSSEHAGCNSKCELLFSFMWVPSPREIAPVISTASAAMPAGQWLP